jgi:hypothetical protein
MTDLTTRRAVEPPEPDRVPGIPDPHPVDPPSVFAAGVELTRLIARAQLTVAQAVELGADVAAEAVRRCAADAGPPDRDPVMAGPVLIGADGRVVPGAVAQGRPDGRASASRPPVGVLLVAIADAVRPCARASGPAAEELLAELDRAVAQLPVAGLRAVAGMLRDAAGAIDRRTVRTEIGALVRAIGVDAYPTTGTGAAGAPGAPPRAATPRRARAGRSGAGRPGTGRLRTGRRRIGAWLLSVLVLAGVVLLEVVFLRDHIVSDVRVLLDAGRGGSAPSTAQRSTDPPLVAPAPASAGPVTGVDLRALGPCSPGSPCSVRLLVRLVPAAGQQVVTWTYRVVDRCTGASAMAAGGSVALPAGGQRAEVIASVPLPVAPGVALVAVTQEPATAASPPVVVGSCPSHR